MAEQRRNDGAMSELAGSCRKLPDLTKKLQNQAEKWEKRLDNGCDGPLPTTLVEIPLAFYLSKED